MSQENVEVVRGLLDAWSQRKVDAILKLIHEDIEWHPALTAGGMEGTVYRGHRDIRSWLRELDDVWAELSHEIEEARDIGEGRVLVLGHFHAVGRESGVPIDRPRDSSSRSMMDRSLLGWAFASQEQAVEAAGLSE